MTSLLESPRARPHVCPLPEMADAFERAGVEFPPVQGNLEFAQVRV
jgi:hypothetical protein